MDLALKIEWSHVSKMVETRDTTSFDRGKARRFGLLDFSAAVREGITVVLGPEGSGKSTLLRLTATLLVPDDGRITFRLDDGETHVWSRGSVITSGVSSLGNLRERISYIPDIPRLDHDVSVEFSLLHLAQLRRVSHPKKRVAEMIARWGLGGYRKIALRELSGPVLKRYLLAQSLVADPKIWILDEPSRGMDDWGRRLLWQELIHRSADRLVLLATSDLELAECADDLLLMEKGSCRRLGRKKWLTAGVPEGTVAAWYRVMQTFSVQSGFR
ncbi:ATP-binding cassette domain-containing protein [Staphylospora marina]|uniref:ATP-binding cassette domain-containing protein n=1 Tax=Staphylospora marina TaxID=2490858 RepID=UPI0013DDAAEE|nr:ATP-binding cassette domain-containing protein [Staphylospora marina]